MPESTRFGASEATLRLRTASFLLDFLEVLMLMSSYSVQSLLISSSKSKVQCPQVDDMGYGL